MRGGFGKGKEEIGLKPSSVALYGQIPRNFKERFYGKQAEIAFLSSFFIGSDEK
jgi:hypothetical protein